MYMVLGVENIGGSTVMRVLARTDSRENAEKVFEAIVLGDAYDKVLLVEVIREG